MKIVRLAYLFFVLTIAGLAQQKSIISGTIKDDAGKILSYVNVYIEKSADGGMSNDKGEFQFTTRQSGKIILTASMVGYKKFSTEINLNKNREVNLQIILSKKSIRMETAIVTGSAYSSEKGKGLVVSPIDIYTTPGGAGDVYQSLKTLPGLTHVSESAELYVRGGNPVETVTMVDGASIHHPFTYESNYGGLFSNLNTGTFKKMFFSSGGFSAKYGNVLSGVLDIETKDIPLSRNNSIGLSFAAADFSMELPVIEEKLGIQIYTQKSYTRPLMAINGGLDDFTATPESQNISSSLTYKYSKTGMIKLLGNYASDLQGVNVKRAEYNGVFDGETNNRFLNLRHTDIIFENTILKTSLSYSGFEKEHKLGILDLNTNDRTYKLRSDLEHQYSSTLKILGGFEVSNREISYLGVIPAEDYDLSPDANSEVINSSYDFEKYGAYFEIEKINLLGIKNFFGIAGIRNDYFPDFEKSWFDPRMSLGYKINDKSTVRFGTGLYRQLPDPILLRDHDGNPDLKPMEAIHFILSYDYNIDSKNSLRIEVYNKNYSFLPFENDDLNYVSSGKGYARGVDFIFKGDLPFNINGWVSYGFIDTKRKWMDFEEMARSTYDITHNMTLVAKYRISVETEIGLNYKIATGRPFTPVEDSKYIREYDVYEPLYGKKNSDSFPVYQRLDCRLSYFFSLFNSKFSIIYLEALNILNIKNLFDYHYNENYTSKERIESYFGRRTLVLGAVVNF